MRRVFRSTLILSASSAVVVLVGIVQAKLLAVLLGPEGLGTIGLLQSVVGLASLVASLGVGTGLVRFIAPALELGNRAAIGATVRAAWILTWTAAVVVVVGMVLFRDPIADALLGDADNGERVALAAVAVVFGLVTGVQTAILNGYHRVGAMARSSIVASVAAAVVMSGMTWRLGERGIAPSIVVSAVVVWFVTRYYVRRDVEALPTTADRGEVVAAGRSLLRFGVPFTGSMAVGTGVQLMMPILVLRMLDAESVGFYRAAMAISVGYLGFLMAAMGKDYFPRVSAASADPGRLAGLINQQLRLVLLLVGPIILGAIALAPIGVPIIYSRAFAPTVEILEWQLIGNLFKFVSWTMAFPILARVGGATFFLTELVGGVALLGSTLLAVQVIGRAGLGLGMLAGYVIYSVVVWVLIRRDIGLRLTTPNIQMIVVAVVAAVAIRLVETLAETGPRTVIGLALAGAAGAWSLRELRRDWQRPDSMSGGLLGLREPAGVGGEHSLDLRFQPDGVARDAAVRLDPPRGALDGN